jgi:SAM-dependent methyltransferase
MGGFTRIAGVSALYLRHGRVTAALRGLRVLAERGLARLGPALGRSHECCLCGWTGPFFLSAYYYDGYRKGAFCPACGSLERHRTLKLFLERELKDWFLERPRRVLDVAPIARGRDLFEFARPRYVSFDLRSPLAAAHGDLCRTPFRPGTFDFVLCYHVLEHIAGEGAALREVHRILRPGGLALLQVPWDPALDRTEEYGAPREEEEGHVRRYGRDVAERWASAGFETLFSDAALRIDPGLVRRLGLDRDIVMLVRKPPR